jgi:hypothetical protein
MGSGSSDPNKIIRKTIVKLLYRSTGILHNNDFYKTND